MEQNLLMQHWISGRFFPSHTPLRFQLGDASALPGKEVLDSLDRTEYGAVGLQWHGDEG